MPGKISFGDEEEARQTEALAGAMIEQTAAQHSLVGSYVSHVSFVKQHWTGEADAAQVQDLVIEFADGTVVRASQAVVDLRGAPSGFREALRDENARQRATAPRGGAIREAGELLGRHPGPKLDAAGDLEKSESPSAYPIDSPTISGTEIKKDIDKLKAIFARIICLIDGHRWESDQIGVTPGAMFFAPDSEADHFIKIYGACRRCGHPGEYDLDKVRKQVGRK